MGTEGENLVSTKNNAISVIVPVYKVEPYLRCCIDSILAQTFTDFELILVDDGSPDNCGAICDEYAAKDNRVVVIHQENAGVSVARNTGLDWMFANSGSRWVTFVDSDDCIVPAYLEHLYRYAVENDADIVITNGAWFSEESELENVSQDIYRVNTWEGRAACLKCFEGDSVIPLVPWGKLWKRSLLVDNRFPVGIIYSEDAHFVMRACYTARKIITLRPWLYCYRQRENSAVHKPLLERAKALFWVLDSQIAFFEEKGDMEMVKAIKQDRSNQLCRVFFKSVKN